MRSLLDNAIRVNVEAREARKELARTTGEPFTAVLNRATGPHCQQKFFKVANTQPAPPYATAREQLGRRWGRLSPWTMAAVEDQVRMLLEL